MLHRLLALLKSIVPLRRASLPVRLPVENLAASDNTIVDDLRPPGEGTRELFGAHSTSERYGYARMEQDGTDPSGPRLFAHHLHNKYGSATVPATSLHHFAVYLNQRPGFITRPAFRHESGFGSAAEREGDGFHWLVDPAVFAACSGDDEYKRAIANEPGMAPGQPVFVIYIDSRSQQQRRFTRTVWPLNAPQAGGKVPLHQALDAAIAFNLRQ